MAEQKRVVIWTDGCFDMMHYGHANALRQVGEVAGDGRRLMGSVGQGFGHLSYRWCPLGCRYHCEQGPSRDE